MNYSNRYIVKCMYPSKLPDHPRNFTPMSVPLAIAFLCPSRDILCIEYEMYVLNQCCILY